jgi:hypothetical protein
MSRLRQHWLAVVFVLLALLAAGGLLAMASGRLRIDGEWPGLLAGALLLLVFWLALRAR